MILDHPLQVHDDRFAHVLLDFLLCISYCYTSRQIRGIRTIAVTSLFNDDKKTIHFISSSGVVLA